MNKVNKIKIPFLNLIDCTQKFRDFLINID